MRFGLFFTFFFLILSCTTQTKKSRVDKANFPPPQVSINTNSDTKSLDLFLKRAVRADQNSNPIVMTWWSQYQRARLWQSTKPERSCQLYLNLASDRLFPLKDLATLRAIEHCSKETPQSHHASSHPYHQYPDWLHPTAVNSFLIQAQKDQNTSQQIDLLITKSKLSTRRPEKLQLTLQALKLTHNLPFRDEAKKLKKQLIERRNLLAPRFIKKARSRDFLKIAYDFRQNRNFSKAKKFYSKVLRRPVSDKTKVKAFHGLRQTYKIERKLKKYLLTTERMAMFLKRQHRKAKAKWKSYFNGLYTLARTYWTMGKKRKAKKSLKLARRFAHKQSMVNVHFVTGRMHEEDGHFKKAIYFFDKALAEPPVPISLREKLNWYKAWNLKKLKRYKESQNLLEGLATTTEEKNLKSKYLFWWAKIEEALQNPQKALQLYEQIIDEDPLSYYSLLAHRSLKKPLQFKTTQSSINTQAHDAYLEKELDVNYLKWLISVDENQVAKKYLDFQVREFRKKQLQDKKLNQKTWLAFFHYYAKAGDYLGLYYQLGSLSSQQKRDILAAHPELLFPQPFKDDVTSAAQQFGMTSEIIYSIMRQESAFNPRARSHMDAFGLMQLLPKVAKETAEKVNINFKRDDDLFKPHVGISLGAAHLRELWERYDGRFILMTASYNASAKAIDNWMKTRFRGNALEFIEDIPYNETQNYVKLIMRNLVFYQALKAENPIPFPEWVLELKTTL